MNNMATKTKKLVQEKYGQIALSSSSCCGGESNCGNGDYTMVSDDYSTLAGYLPDADLGLGCGLPTASARLQPGETVLDLGAGAGNDLFVARSLVGEQARLIGVDMTAEMVQKARRNAEKIGATNVEFRLGDIENLPVESATIDVVISNCVLNLVPDKARAFAEIYRVLRPGGRFCISDIVVTCPLPPAIQQAAEMYVGCVAGAKLKDDYLAIINQTGFIKVTVEQEKIIRLPHQVLADYLTAEEIAEFGNPVVSVTVTGER